MSSTTAAPDLRCLLTSWTVHLRAERKSPSTIESYTTGVRLFLDYCADAGCPAVVDRPTVNAFVAGLLDSGAEAATARSPAAVDAPVLGVVRRGGRDRPG